MRKDKTEEKIKIVNQLLDDLFCLVLFSYTFINKCKNKTIRSLFFNIICLLYLMLLYNEKS